MRQDLAGHAWQKLSLKQVKGSLAKLRKAELLHNERFVVSRGVAAYVMRRTVFGAYVIDTNRGDMIAVPTPVISALVKLPRRGGARKGAGRKPKHLAERKEPNNLIQTVPHRRRIQKVPDTSYIYKGLGVGVSSKEETSSAPTGSVLLSLFDETKKSTGSTVCGSSERIYRSDDRLFGPHIPAFPGPSVVKPAQVPDPPKMDAELSPTSRAVHLSEMYQGVRIAKTGKRDWGLRNLENNKRRMSMFTNAAGAFVEHELSPVAWMAWSLDFWFEQEDAKPPRVEWLLSPKRIVKHRGFFRNNVASYSGGRLIHGEKYKELTKRYMRMRSCLLNTSEPVADIVARFFPGKRYAQLVEETKEEASNIQVGLRNQISRGDYVRDNSFLW